MNAERPDPDAELQGGEPLRLAFAVLALVLGLIAAFHS